MSVLRRNKVSLLFILLFATVSIMVYSGIRYLNTTFPSTIQEPQDITSVTNPEPSSHDIYSKLRTSSMINGLVVGDIVGAGGGVSASRYAWFSIVERELEKRYFVNMHIEALSTGGNTILDGLVDYSLTKMKSAYDIVFICFGLFDQHVIDVDRFARLYEQLIRTLKEDKNNPEIYIMIEHAIEDDRYLERLIELADYYDLGLVNVFEAFRDSGESLHVYMTEDLYPNQAGHEIYASTVLSQIEQHIQSNKTVEYVAPAPLMDLQPNPTVQKSFPTQEGFIEHNGLLTSEGEPGVLETTLTGNLLGVMLYRTPNSGFIDVIVDGVNLASIDGYGDNRLHIHWFPEEIALARGTVRLEVSGERSSESTGYEANIVGIITN